MLHHHHIPNNNQLLNQARWYRQQLHDHIEDAKQDLLVDVNDPDVNFRRRHPYGYRSNRLSSILTQITDWTDHVFDIYANEEEYGTATRRARYIHDQIREELYDLQHWLMMNQPHIRDRNSLIHAAIQRIGHSYNSYVEWYTRNRGTASA